MKWTFRFDQDVIMMAVRFASLKKPVIFLDEFSAGNFSNESTANFSFNDLIQRVYLSSPIKSRRLADKQKQTNKWLFLWSIDFLEQRAFFDHIRKICEMVAPQSLKLRKTH